MFLVDNLVLSRLRNKVKPEDPVIKGKKKAASNEAAIHKFSQYNIRSRGFYPCVSIIAYEELRLQDLLLLQKFSPVSWQKDHIP